MQIVLFRASAAAIVNVCEEGEGLNRTALPFVLTVLLLLNGGVLPRVDAHASSTCTFDVASGNLFVSVLGDAVISAEMNAEIVVDGQSCTPFATLTTVDSVVISGSSGRDSLTIDSEQHAFAPGATPETAGESEIEFGGSLGDGWDRLIWIGTSGNDHVAARTRGINGNGDGDADVAVEEIESLTLDGRAGADILIAWAERVSGGRLKTLIGGEGPDDLRASGGKQTLYGGPHRDVLSGGPGADSLTGGSGVDTLDFSRSPRPVDIDLQAGTASGLGEDRVAGFERLRGSIYADRLSGDGKRNIIMASAGHDVLEGGEGADRLRGGSGDDQLMGGRGWDHCVQELGLGHQAACEAPARRVTPGFALARGHSVRAGSGRLMRFTVEVERASKWKPIGFARAVSLTLFDRRSWPGNEVSLKRVDSNPHVRILLATRASVDRLCAPVDTKSQYSCFNEVHDRVVINGWRWRKGSPAYPNSIQRFRHYVVNHEVGHALGLGHHPCPGKGALAPVMKPQTATAPLPCRSNPWPLKWERATLR